MRFGDIFFIEINNTITSNSILGIISNNRIVGQNLKGIFLEKRSSIWNASEKAISNQYMTITRIKNLSEAVRNKEFDQNYLDNIIRNFTSNDETLSEMTILALKEISRL